MGLNKAINKLREALSDEAESPRYIETLPRRGYRFIGTVTPSKITPPIPPQSFRASRAPYAFAAAAAILVALAVYWFGLGNRPARPALPTRAMLAVLPFQNLSGDNNEDYFADGLTEEMIAQLGQLQPASLGVIARTSAMQEYKGKHRPNRTGAGRALLTRRKRAARRRSRPDYGTVDPGERSDAPLG
jgi:hypothetical protein